MRIAVLFGGTSIEREVSRATAGQVFRALAERGHQVSAFDTAKGLLSSDEEHHLMRSAVAVNPPELSAIPESDIVPQLAAAPDQLGAAEVVFLALHGGAGEDGTIQGMLDSCGIRYTGSGLLPCAISMDKEISKKLFRSVNVPTPSWIMSPAEEETVAKELGFPVVVKPNKQGSTVGLSVVRESQELGNAVRMAGQFGTEVIIERFIPGREFVVGILDGQALAVGEIVPKRSEVFDYRSKYQPGEAEETFPAHISASQTQEMQRIALHAHAALKLGSYSRVDFRMDEYGGLWCLEANTLPGMTSTSLLPQSAAAAGISFPELCERICISACEA